MKVCYFGAYNRSYPRNSILRKGLKENGVDVVECHIPFFSRYTVRYKKLLEKYFSLRDKFDAILVAEINQFVVPLAKLIAVKHGVPLLFDIFFSLYDSNVWDRNMFKSGSLPALYFRFLDKLSLIISDVVITDTESHLQYYHRSFGVPVEKMRVIIVGNDPERFHPLEIGLRKKEKFVVSFIGSFIPLHGVKYIVQAARLVQRHRDISFEIVGDGQTFRSDYELAGEIGCDNILFIKPVPAESLPNYIHRADVCLGIFGDTAKASRVIPNKVFHALGMRKPVITGKSPAIEEIFRHGEHLLMCEMANASSLAKAIIKLRDDTSLSNVISESGYRVVKESLNPKALGAKVVKAIRESRGKMIGRR